MATSNRVFLGFVQEECDPRLLRSHYFPSKVGGRPAWLSLNPLPSTEELICPKCCNPMVFLLQVYSPRDSQDEAFHRTLFIFACRTPGCSSPQDSSSFAVFRSQLPRANKYYSYDAYPEDPSEISEPVPSARRYAKLCAVCGCIGSKKCSQCQAVSYCSKHHQARHWHAAHKKVCKKQDTQAEEDKATASDTKDGDTQCGILFSEFELEEEEEKEQAGKPVHAPDSVDVTAECDRLRTELPEAVGGSGQGLDAQELEDMANQETEDDRYFRKFKKRVALYPDQVLRYNRGGQPLWVASQHKARLEDIPRCLCGADRELEFQVMPQLLYYLKVDDKAVTSLDWGTLCVYTCSRSCPIGDKYFKEFLWKQDFVGEAR